MGRRLVVLFALVACAALIVLLQRGGVFRAPSRPGLPESPVQPKDVPDAAEPPGDPIPTREPTFLPGHVYGPDGGPVEKAEVRVVHPKTYDLVRSDKDGAYRLPIDRSGRFLIEAALTTELAPAREWVETPEDGDPAPLDFHLEQARGAIFGDLTLDGVPVDESAVVLSATDASGDESSVSEAHVDAGYFNFYLDPPKDVPLRLDVRSPWGILAAPLRFTWAGKPMDLGRVELAPYPSARIRMRLPDGTYAKGVVPMPREELEENLRHMDLLGVQRAYPSPGALVVVPVKEDVTARFVFLGAAPPPTVEQEPGVVSFLDWPVFMVEREVTLFFGRRQEIELVVPRGPTVVSSRLLDREGKGLRGHVRCGENEAATGEDGAFTLTVPHGGLHVVHLVGLDVPGIGPVELARDAPAQSMLLDADHPADCVYDTRSRILLLAASPCAFELMREQFSLVPDQYISGKERLEWSVKAAEGAQASCLSPRLLPGSYRWTSNDTRGRARSGEVRVDAGALAIVDTR